MPTTKERWETKCQELADKCREVEQQAATKSPFISGPWGAQLTALGRTMTPEHACKRATLNELDQLIVWLEEWRDAAVKERVSR